VKLALFDHREITTSLNWSIPATVCLLLSAIAQPLRGARVALVIVGAVCLLLAMRRSVPRISRALDTIKLMRWGRLSLGRILKCGMGWGPLSGMVPFADFVKKVDAVDDYTYPRYLFGCLFGFIGIMMAIPAVGFVVMLVLAFLMKLLNVRGVTFQGDYSFAFFVQSIGMVIVVVLMFFLVRFIMIIVYMMKLDEVANEDRGPEEQVSKAAALERELRVAFSLPMPKSGQQKEFPDENLDWMLACKVEYPGIGKIRAADAPAHFSPRLNRSGVEPLLFHPGMPGRIELLVGLPVQIALANGEWVALPVAGPAFKLAITAVVFLLALTALGYEALALAMGPAS
jgi:uncharacterized membrane protein